MCAYIIYYISFFLFIMRVLRKPSSPPLPLREGPPLSPSPFPFRVQRMYQPPYWCFFLKSTRPSFFDKAGCTRQFESELSLRSFAQPFPSGDRGCANRPFNSLYDPFGSPYRGQKRCSNRFAIRLADHQRSTPAAELRFFCAG